MGNFLIWEENGVRIDRSFLICRPAHGIIPLSHIKESDTVSEEYSYEKL